MYDIHLIQKHLFRKSKHFDNKKDMEVAINYGKKVGKAQTSGDSENQRKPENIMSTGK